MQYTKTTLRSMRAIRLLDLNQCDAMGFARRNTLKLPPTLLAKVAAEAKRRNVSQSTIVRESLERALADSAGRDEPSCADLAGALVGSFRSGRRDLSTNKRWLADTVASKPPGGRKRHC